MEEQKVKTVSKNTNELKDGDVIVEHGLVFELKEGRTFPCEYTGHGQVFKTNLIARIDQTNMPKHWQNTWTVQGNANAKWAVIE
jgi:hypothetical protein